MSRSSKGDDALSSGHETSNIPAENQTETAPAKQKRPPSPRNCRDYLRRQTAYAMPDIVKVFVGKAKKGSVPHFTSLTKVGGFDQRATSSDAPKRRRRSLARQLLDEVEKYEARQAAEFGAAKSTGQIDNHGSQERS